jgi:hypothetical protein
MALRKLAPDEVKKLGLKAEELPEWQPPPEPHHDETSATEAGVLGAGQGASFGFIDELGGAIGSMLMPSSNVKLGKGAMPQRGDSPEVLEAKRAAIKSFDESPSNYQLVRDNIRKRMDKAKEEHGGIYTGAEVGGSLLTGSLVPGGATSTFARSVGLGAGMGAATGLGNSRADLTEGDVDGVLEDTGKGALLGGAGGAVGYGVGRGIKAVGNKFGRAAAEKEAGLTAEATLEGEKEVAGAVGQRMKQGQEANAAMDRALDMKLRKEKMWLAQANANPFEKGFQQRQAVVDQEMQAAKELEQFLRKWGDKIPDRDKARLLHADRALEEFYLRPIEIPKVDIAAKVAAKKASENASANEGLRKAIMAGGGAALGYAVGGPTGAAIGAGLGYGTGTVHNYMKSPQFLEWAMGASKWGPALTRMGQKYGQPAVQAFIASLIDRDPQFRKEAETQMRNPVLAQNQ